MFTTNEISSIDELLAEAKSSPFKYDLNRIKAAYEFASAYHGTQERKSGQPFIIHPLTVAAYMVRLGLDTTSVEAALLHDTVEDTNTNLEEIDRKFGTEVAFIVDGLTNMKLYTAQFPDHNEGVENFRKLILKSTEDIRIILIRLADKLHNLQTVHFLKPEKQINFAKKVKLIYAPLAEYMGLGYFQSLLENKAFEILEPETSQVINSSINNVREKSEPLFRDLQAEIAELLAKYNISNYEMTGRAKGTYSAYKKIKHKYLQPGENVTPEAISQLHDILGIRIITDTVESCYLILGLIHSRWKYEFEEFDDYVTTPKPNGYRSIHTVIDYEGQPVEIQIRTAEMHAYNEFGPASHIAYKLRGSAQADTSYTWTKDLVEWQNKEVTGQSNYKIQAFSESIFVFTPKGKVVQLDKNSGPLDFAFQIHTDLGAHYLGAKVNNKMVAMSHKLETGDIVEIVVSNRDNINRDWLKYAEMTSTKARIRKWLRGHSFIAR